MFNMITTYGNSWEKKMIPNARIWANILTYKVQKWNNFKSKSLHQRSEDVAPLSPEATEYVNIVKYRK